VSNTIGLVPPFSRGVSINCMLSFKPSNFLSLDII
jgi:hypothetical protein